MKKFFNVSCVLFDHDGTIVDTESRALEDSVVLINQVMSVLNQPFYHKEDLTHVIGTSFRETLLRELTTKGLSISENFLNFLIKERTRRAVETMEQFAVPTPGAVETIQALHQNNIKMAVVSNSTTDRLQASLETTGIAQLIPKKFVFSAQDSFDDGLPRTKPSPDIHYLALEKLAQKPENTIIIEDTPIGIQAAMNAGIKAIGYVGGVHLSAARRQTIGQELLDLGAVTVIDHMKQLLDLIEFKNRREQWKL